MSGQPSKLIAEKSWGITICSTAHLLYSVHNGDRILVWDLATGKSPIHICDLQTEISSKVLSTDSWKDDRGVGFMVGNFTPLTILKN